MREWLGRDVVLVAVVCSVVGMSPCLYLVVHAAAPTACACVVIPHGLASAGTAACVSWCSVPFFIFLCGALRLGGLFPLSLSHTFLFHGFLFLCVRGIVGVVFFCWWGLVVVGFLMR